MHRVSNREPRPSFRRPLPRTGRWLLPPAVIVVIGFLGILLYMGGLGTPSENLREFPIAVVNEDDGARMPSFYWAVVALVVGVPGSSAIARPGCPGRRRSP